MKYLVKSTLPNGFCLANGQVIGATPVELDTELAEYNDVIKFFGKGISVISSKEEAKPIAVAPKPVEVAPVVEAPVAPVVEAPVVPVAPVIETPVAPVVEAPVTESANQVSDKKKKKGLALSGQNN